MPTYEYKARDTLGKSVKGKMDAADRGEIIDKLRKMSYMPTYVAEVAEGVHMEIGNFFERFKRITSNDMIMFYIQFSNMINAGITILAALYTLNKQMENRALKEIIGDIARRVEGGESLSQALSNHQGVFPKLFVNMIKAGEVSGKIDTVLLRYAEFYEHQIDLKQKVTGALFYPVILLCVGVSVILFIVTTIIPQFAQLYTKAGIKLPVPTLIVYNAGIAIKHYWYMLAVGIAAIAAGIHFYSKTVQGRFIVDSLKLKIPVIGSLYRSVAITRFAKTLGTLLESGVPILESLDITKNVIGNAILEHTIANVRTAVERGERMSVPLKVSEEFPPYVVEIIAVGEESGKLDEMLGKIADFYDRNVSYAIKKLTTIIEPVFLIIMGCMVGFIMASMLMPIFDMVKTLRH